MHKALCVEMRLMVAARVRPRHRQGGFPESLDVHIKGISVAWHGARSISLVEIGMGTFFTLQKRESIPPYRSVERFVLRLFLKGYQYITNHPLTRNKQRINHIYIQ